jgi:hypothetical protein
MNSAMHIYVIMPFLRRNTIHVFTQETDLRPKLCHMRIKDVTFVGLAEKESEGNL